jgi:flagellar biosynthesis protein FlhG
MPEQAIGIDQAEGLRRMVSLAKGGMQDHRPYVITVTSGKGGVGKSTIALNLAVKFADRGRKVLLMDGDSNVGNLDIMFGLSPERRLDDILGGVYDIGDVLIEAMPNLAFLPGASGDRQRPRYDEDIQNRFLGDLVAAAGGYDYIVIDTAAGLSAEIIGYALYADEVLIVTTPEMTAIVDAYAAIKMIAGRNREIPTAVILNNARSLKEAEEAFMKLKSAVAHFLKISIRSCGTVPSDSCVHKAIAAQEPVVRRYPDCAAAHSIDRLAQHYTAAASPARVRKAAGNE